MYIFDIDGTLANLTHRLHFIQGEKKDWDSFFLACEDDKPILDVKWICERLRFGGELICLVTGRSDICREQTVKWLWANRIIYDSLYMRKAGDHRPDHVVKSELLDLVIKYYGREIINGIFEDRKQVVNMYRSRGFRVYQVAEGDF